MKSVSSILLAYQSGTKKKMNEQKQNARPMERSWKHCFLFNIKIGPAVFISNVFLSKVFTVRLFHLQVTA